MLFIIILFIVGYCYCKWGVRCHDPMWFVLSLLQFINTNTVSNNSTTRSDYVPSSTDEWEVQFYGFGLDSAGDIARPPLSFLDDKTGYWWIISLQFLNEDNYTATAIDTETGTIVLHETIRYLPRFGDVVRFFQSETGLTSNGDLVFFNVATQSLESVPVNVSQPRWKYHLEREDMRLGQVAVSSNDLIIVNSENNILAIKYGSESGQGIVWSLDLLRNIQFMGSFTIVNDERLYFTELCRYLVGPDQPASFHIVDLKTGKLLQKKPYNLSTPESFPTRFTVDDKNSIVYFVDNWSYDTFKVFPGGPFLLAMEDMTLKQLWNITLGCGLDTYCQFPVLAFPSQKTYPLGITIVLCNYFHDPSDEYFNPTILRLIDNSKQKVIKKIKFHGATGDIVVMKGERYILFQVADTPYHSKRGIYAVDLLTGEVKDLKIPLGQLYGNYYPIADSGGCIYFCTAKMDFPPITCKKKCGLIQIT